MKRVRRKFVYDSEARQAASMRRRLTPPIADLLKLSVKEMSDEELTTRIREWLETTDLEFVASWIASLRKKPGRPRGRRTKLPTRSLAGEWIKEQLKRRKRRWCSEHERKRVTRAVTTKFVKELIAAAGKRYPDIRVPFEVREFDK